MSGAERETDLFVSVDLDGIHHHLRGYAEPAEPTPINPIYATALPRILALFERLDLTATFFVVGEDAAANAAALRDVTRRGHEIASQSLTHPLPFAAISAERLEHEVSASRRELERVVEAPVAGFRAPGFAASRALFAALARAGYAYDSSVFASPIAAAAMLALPAQRRKVLTTLPFAVAKGHPHRLPNGLWEVPMSVTPLLRLPFYQTLAVSLGPRGFARAAHSLLRRPGSLHYVLHGIDFLASDELDPRLHRHPGAKTPLATKLDDLAARLRLYTEGRQSVPLARRFGVRS